MARWVSSFAAILRSRAARQRRAVLFVVPGASGSFSPVNLELYRDSAAFRDSIDCTSALIETLLGWTAAAAYRGENAEPTVPAIRRRNEIVHHGMTRIALIDHWRAAGVTADGAIGVSLGELISPYAVGAISREDCARLVAVLAQALLQPPSAHRVYLVEMNGVNARRLCRNAAVTVDFIGTSDHGRSLVLSRESDSSAVRDYFGSALVHEAPSGWPYHTPAMHFDHGWAHARLGCGVVLRRPSRTIYSPATGALLPDDICLDAQFIHWAMSSPCHFADAAATAIADGFDVIVQIASKPTRVFGDVAATAQAEGRRIEQFHALDPNACVRVRAMKRCAPVPAAVVSAVLQLEDHWWRAAPEGSPDLVTERICERLLQPLLARKPFDVVSGLADPLVDALAVDRDAFARLLASSVLLLLKEDSIRCRLTSDPGLVRALVAANARAAATQVGQVQRAQQAVASAVRTLLRLAPDFTALQPLGTVDLVNGKIPQLVIAR